MTATSQDLGLRLRDLGRSMRRLKQVRPNDAGAVAAGLVPVLTHIDEFPDGCHVGALAGRIGLDPSTISRAVASLVDHGLVERRADPHDGRASRLVLTAAGRAALAGAQQHYGELLGRALADWTPEEITALSGALARFTSDIDSYLSHHNSQEAAR